MMKLKKIPTQQDKSELSVEGPKYPPTFSVDEDQIPEIAQWEVGKKYQMMVEVEMKSKNKESDQGVNGRFQIMAYDAMADKDPKDMNNEEFRKYHGKVMASMVK